ncbi:MAG: hypothetical protein QXP38_12190 [Nitrososphaerota archaeon]
MMGVSTTERYVSKMLAGKEFSLRPSIPSRKSEIYQSDVGGARII